MSVMICDCCGQKISRAGSVIEESLQQETELEGGVFHPLEEVEELRLVIGSFMNKELLDAILFLYKELSREPRHSEMYSWFVRNSQYQGQCKFALGALKRFKEKRLDILIPLLEKALEGCKKLRKEDVSK